MEAALGGDSLVRRINNVAPRSRRFRSETSVPRAAALTFSWGVVLALSCFGCQVGHEAGAGTPTERVEDDGSNRVKSEQRLLELVNARRAEPTRQCGSKVIDGSLRSLKESTPLACAAVLQCQGMASHGYFAHEAPEHSTPTARARTCGFSGSVAENLAWGQADAPGAVDAWMRSPGHCRNLFEARAAYGGVAHCTGAGGKALWVLVVGSQD